MPLDRRTLLRGLPPALAFPYLLRSQPADAALDFRKIGQPIALGNTQPGGKRGVTLSAFDGNTFIAGWINTRAFGSDLRVFVQKRHRNGSPLSQPIQMGGGPLTDGIVASGAAVVALPDGTSLVFFAAQRNGAASANAMDIFVQRMSANFQKVGNPIAVNTTLSGTQDAVHAVRLKNGNVLVVWASTPADFSSSTIRGRIFKPNGQPASPERTMIHTTTGTHVPMSLGLGPNGGALLSYVRIFDNAQAAPKATVLQKIVQVLRGNGLLLGNPLILDTTTPDRWFGSIAIPVHDDFNPFDPDYEPEVVFLCQPPTTGNVTQIHRYDFNFGPPAPDDATVATLRIDPLWQGPPRALMAQENGIGYSFLWVPHTKPNLDREIWGYGVRNKQVVSKVNFFFDEASVTPDAVAGLNGEGVLGYSAGDDAFSEGAFLQRFGTFR